MRTLAFCLWRSVSHFSAVLWHVPVLRPWLAVGLALLFLTAPAYAATVSVAWDPPSTNSAQVSGYNLYYWQPLWASPARVSVGKNTTYTLTGLEDGKTYSIAVTALDSTGKGESKYSNIVEMKGVIPPANTAPVAKSDAATTAEDTAVSIAVLGNDTDANGDPLTITAVTPGANGTVVHAGTAVTYTPKANFHGTDAFTYTVSDGKGGTATGTVSVTVTSVNDTPVAYNSTLTTAEDTMASGTLSASDVDKEALSYRLVSQGSKGTVTLTNTATGAYTYRPQPNLFGTDTFTFHVSDGKVTSNVATVAVTITPVNDVPAAGSDTATTAEKRAVTVAVLANDTDADGDPLTIMAVTPGANGTVVRTGTAVTYTPKTDFHGTDAFTYTVSDGKGGTATGKVSVTVTPVNDAPVAHNGTLTTPAATKTSGTLSASDVDKDTLTYQLVSQGSKGTITLTNTTTGAYTYTAKPQMTGTDTFTFRVSDGKATSNTATVTVTITSAEAENVIFAVNAGGPRYVDAAGIVYEADTRFSGGSPYTSTAPIAGTDDDVLYQNVRYGNFAYAIPVPNGNYVVTLRFAEVYWTAAGQRVFDVLLEGQEVVSNLDVFAKVGKNAAYDVKLPVQVTDEVLNLQFRTDRDNANVSAIVVAVVDEPPSTVVFAVNAGGPRYVDAAGIVYEADTQFSGGDAYTRPDPIAGTDDDVLYQSERWGNFAYAIPVPNGDYTVTLRFADLYWAKAGQRVFDVLIEGQEVVSNLDLVATAGPLTAHDVKIPVQVTDEELNIRFQANVSNAIVSAIVVEVLGD